MGLQVTCYWNDPNEGTEVVVNSTMDPVGTRIPNPLAWSSEVPVRASSMIEGNVNAYRLLLEIESYKKWAITYGGLNVPKLNT